MEKVVALADALADSHKNTGAAVFFDDVIDQLQDDDAFAAARAPQNTRFASLDHRKQQVHVFHTGLEHFQLGAVLALDIKVLGPQRAARHAPDIALQRAHAVLWFAENVNDAPVELVAHADLDGFL